MNQLNTLNIVRGDDKRFVVTFKDANDVAIDVSGWKLYFTVKENLTDSDDNAKIKIDVTVESGEGTNGEITIHVEPSDTEDLDVGKYYYDIQAKKDDGEIFTPLTGEFLINIDVTRRST